MNNVQDAAIQEHFKKAAPFWRNVYGQNDVYALIHQQRRDTVLSIVEDLHLAPGTKALDIGCGAGSISVSLASRGLDVRALDAVPEMIALTKRQASDSGVSSHLVASVGDIHDLEFSDNSFQLVLAIGVLPWLSEQETAVREMARVLKPGGYLLLNIDNCWGLHRILDPLTNFLLARLRVAVGRLLRLLGLRNKKRGISTSLMSIAQFDSLLCSNGLKPLRANTMGFGPFTIFQREIFSTSVGVHLHTRLQRLCDRGVPVLRSMGGQYLVLAQKECDS